MELVNNVGGISYKGVIDIYFSGFFGGYKRFLVREFYCIFVGFDSFRIFRFLVVFLNV